MFAATDCDFACFTAGFTVVRDLGNITLASMYVGPCNCSSAGTFYGSLDYASGAGMSISAANANSETLFATPFFTANQIVVQISSATIDCTYTWNVAQGSLLGLPRSNVAQSDAQPSGVQFLGQVSGQVSGNEAPAARRRSLKRMDPWALGNWFSLRSTDDDSIPDQIQCPPHTADCRYDCLAGGFTAEVFGASIVMASQVRLLLTPRVVGRTRY